MAAVASTAAAPPSLSSICSSTRLRQGSTAVFHSGHLPRLPLHQTLTSTTVRFRPPRAVQETKDAEAAARPSPQLSDAEETTLKYGLEVGLWKIFSSKNDESGGDPGSKSKGNQAKELLAKYGGAYLATSITLSAISFTACYLLVNAGVDVQGLLQHVGITVDEAGEKVGTFALAYAAHKAASPIRFPPTVALTPVVAGWIGKKTDGGGKEKGAAGDGSK